MWQKTGLALRRAMKIRGQTLGFYGVIPGPYLVLPFLPATDVRDGLGSVFDAAMNPLNYLIPFAAGADGATTFGALTRIGVTDAVNRRSLDLETYEGVEETVVDLYSAVRNGYLQKRETMIER